MTLHDLSPGDKFVHAKRPAKVPKQFLVKGNPEFNIQHGSSTRLCVDLLTQAIVSKSCRLEVKKIGESIQKSKMIEEAKKK